MANSPSRDLIQDLGGGPRRKQVQGIEIGGSLLVTIDKDAARACGIDFEDPPRLDTWVYEKEGKVVVDLDP